MRNPISIVLIIVNGSFCINTVSAETPNPSPSITYPVSFPYQDAPVQPTDPKQESGETEAKPDKEDPKPRIIWRRGDDYRMNALASTEALTFSRMPMMWGDFFDGTPYPLTITNPEQYPPEWGVGSSGGGGGRGPKIPRAGGLATRRVKLSENSSPLPTNRWILNHNYFNDVDSIGDINRYTFGFEKTFDEGLKSIEARFSFANTLSSTQFFDGPANLVTKDFADEPGNLVLTYKSVIRGLKDGIVTAGLGIALPTANDQLLFSANPTNPALLLKIHNDAVHLMPFIAFLRQPSEKMIVQGFAQADFSSIGNPVLVRTTPAPSPLTDAAKIRDVPLLFLDLGLAYKWIENREGLVNAVTPLLELHYSMGMGRQDRLRFPHGTPLDNTFTFGGPNRISVLNLTAGASLEIGDSIVVRPAVSVPLSNGAGASYDYEFGVHVNILQ